MGSQALELAGGFDGNEPQGSRNTGFQPETTYTTTELELLLRALSSSYRGPFRAMHR